MVDVHGGILFPPAVNPINECFERRLLLGLIMRPPVFKHQLAILLANGAQKIFKSSLHHRIPFDIECHIRNYQLKAGGRLWAAVVYQGKRVARNGKLRDSYRWIRGFRTQKAAETELNKVLRSIDEGTYVELSKQTMSEYLDRWLTTVNPNLAPKTFERYKQLVTVNINPKLGPIKLTKLQPLQIAEFYTWSSTAGNRRTGEGLSARTVLHIHRLLRKALQQAVIWQLRPTNPADAVETPRPEDKEMQPIDEDRAV